MKKNLLENVAVLLLAVPTLFLIPIIFGTAGSDLMSYQCETVIKRSIVVIVGCCTISIWLSPRFLLSLTKDAWFFLFSLFSFIYLSGELIHFNMMSETYEGIEREANLLVQSYVNGDLGLIAGKEYSAEEYGSSAKTLKISNETIQESILADQSVNQVFEALDLQGLISLKMFQDPEAFNAIFLVFELSEKAMNEAMEKKSQAMCHLGEEIRGQLPAHDLGTGWFWEDLADGVEASKKSREESEQTVRALLSEYREFLNFMGTTRYYYDEEKKTFFFDSDADIEACSGYQDRLITLCDKLVILHDI